MAICLFSVFYGEGRVIRLGFSNLSEDSVPGLFDEGSFSVFRCYHVVIDEVLDEVVVEVGFRDVVVSELECSVHEGRQFGFVVHDFGSLVGKPVEGSYYCRALDFLKLESVCVRH